MLHNLVMRNVKYIRDELGITDEDEIDKIRFGIETIVGEVFKLTVIFFISLFVNRIIEFFVVLSLLLSIRTAIGGSHAKSLTGCLFKSSILFMAIYYFSYKITFIPIIIEIIIIATIIGVLSTVKYRNKIDLSGGNEEKNKKLRIRLILISIIYIISGKLFLKRLYSLIIITLVTIIIDYIKVERGRIC